MSDYFEYKSITPYLWLLAFALALFVANEIYEMRQGNALNDAPYRGEPCSDEPLPYPTCEGENRSLCILQARQAEIEVTMENRLKGYCKDGERIGGVR